MVGNGLGFWKTIPIGGGSHGVDVAEVVDVVAVEQRRGPRRARPGITSCMRLRQRTIVDLPQPEGPMMAVTRLAGKRRSTPRTRSEEP